MTNLTWKDTKRGVSLTLDNTEKRHGIISLNTGETELDIVREPYFLLNVYRVWTTGKLWTIARYEPFSTDIHGDGITLHWNPTATLPVEMRATYVVDGKANAKLRLRVRAVRDLPNFEISISSYFDFSYEPYGVLKVPRQDGSKESDLQLWKAQDQPLLRGYYVNLPRDNQGAIMRMDGRWNDPKTGKEIGSAINGPHYGLPAAVMATQDRWILQYTSRDCCDGVSLTYSSDNPKDNIRNHNAIYFSLFGENLKQGDERQAEICQVLLDGKPEMGVIEDLMSV